MRKRHANPSHYKRQDFPQIISAIKFGEEAIPAFPDKLYYPVLLGDIYHNCYRIVTNLEYDSNSIVWLSFDQKQAVFISSVGEHF